MSIEKTMKGRVINKHRTEQEWYNSVYRADGSFVDSPFIPLDGELIIYDPDDVNKERRFKFGDGVRYVTDLPFAVNTTTGSGDNSLQFAGAGEASGEGSIAMGDESSSVTDYSVAIGKEVTAGCKAYYFSAIDLANKNIYLSETKEELPVINNSRNVIHESTYSNQFQHDSGLMPKDIAKKIVEGVKIIKINDIEFHYKWHVVRVYGTQIMNQFSFEHVNDTNSRGLTLNIKQYDDGREYDSFDLYVNGGVTYPFTCTFCGGADSNIVLEAYYNSEFETPSYLVSKDEEGTKDITLTTTINTYRSPVVVDSRLGAAFMNGTANINVSKNDISQTVSYGGSVSTPNGHIVTYYIDDSDSDSDEGYKFTVTNDYTRIVLDYSGYVERTKYTFDISLNAKEMIHTGDEFCLINGEYHPIFCGKITAVDHNKITYEGDLGFTEISTTTTRDFDKDHVFYTPTNPSIGVIENLFVGSFAAGRYNVAAGEDAIVAGYGNIVGANHGAAFGKNNRVGNFGFVTGNSNDATGSCAYVEGKENINKGYMAHVEGRNNEVAKADSENNRYVHVEGYQNTHLKGKNNHVEGVLQKINDGSYTHVEGYKQTVNSGTNLHIEGRQNTSTGGTDNHIEGYNQEVEEGTYTHVEGNGNTVKYGRTNHIEGEGHTVEMPNSSIGHNHIEGRSHTVKSRRSHVQGDGNEARLRDDDNKYIEALDLTGYHNIGSGSYQTVAGKYNEAKSDIARITGGGSSESDRKNIEELDWNGNLTLAGNVNAGGATFTANIYTYDEVHSVNGFYTEGSIRMEGGDVSGVGAITSESLNVTGNSIFGTGHTVDSANTQVEGTSNTVTSAKGYNHVEGYLNEVNARYSHVEGVANEVTGDVNRVHVEGWHNIANANDQHVAGKYNKSNTNAVRITGWGTSNTNRKNIEELDQSGNAWFAGSVTVGTDRKTLATEEFVNSILTSANNYTDNTVAQKSQVQFIIWEDND